MQLDPWRVERKTISINAPSSLGEIAGEITLRHAYFARQRSSKLRVQRAEFDRHCYLPRPQSMGWYLGMATKL